MFARAPMSWGELLAVLLVGVLILYVLIAAASPGNVADVGTNKTWGRWIAREGIHSAYQIPTDYPPVLLYFFGAAGRVYQWLADPTFDEQAALASQFYTLLVKLPGILFHPIAAAVIYRITRQYGAGLAFAAAAAYALNPAVAYDVAHLGQTDPVHAAFALLAVAALVHRRPGLAGACIALAALTKPQAWLLLPVVGMALIFWYGWRGVLRGTIGGAVASFVVVLPWAVTNRLHHAGRFLEALDTKSINSIALTAQAHNLWWVPTLIEWRFITDSEPFVGPVPYRVVGLGMVALLVAAAIARLPSLRPRDCLYGIAGALTVGWFVLTVRAHENLLFMALPFLTVAWALDRRLGLLLVVTSASLLLNVALHDPLLMGNYAAGPDPGYPLPVWVIVAQVVNVLMNLAACGLAIGHILGPTLSGSWAQRVAGRPVGTGSGR
ncbi:MAG: glycosyltransferase 87 family protein [Chloroflexota bacterium]|nr:glycosyltransferase 87 family protein [Chloroflexota bacterium]